MSKKRRHKAKRKRTAKPLPLQTAKDRPYRGREMLRDILKGFLFIAIGLAIKLAIEHTRVGEQMQLMSYNLLQMQLSSDSTPITIVDISNLPATDVVGGQTVSATPREPLRDMISAIAEQRPRTIGIDIDFSPDEDGYVHPGDPEFFEFCLDLQREKGVPVFLGVNRTIAKPPDEWLGNKKFEPLAANILIPKDSRRMLNVMWVHDDSNAIVSPAEKRTPSRSMSALLAEAYSERDTTAVSQGIYSLLTRLELVERFTERDIRDNLSVQDFPIDYGAIDSIERERIETIDPRVLRDSSNRKHLAGRVILIGDATLGKATDTFVIPSRDQPYPGVLLHASAAYTLIKAPLYDLTHSGHIVLDLLLSGIILLVVVLVKLRYKQVETREVAARKWRGLLTVLIVFAAIVFGVVFVRSTRILWDDFFLVLILLVFHPSFEHHGETFWAWIKRNIFRLENRLPTDHDGATSLKISCLALLLSGVMILSCSARVVAQQERPVAIIENFSGTVILKRDGKQIRLNPKSDIARRLFTGDSIYCAKGAKLTLRIGSKKTDLDETSKWFVIPNRMSSRSDRADRVQSAINEYGRIGGRNRGVPGKSTLFSPADESVVTPELFTIRWVPGRRNCVAVIEIQGAAGEVLWQGKNIDSASGKLDSEIARQVLNTYRAASGVGTLRVKLKDSCGNTAHSDFTLLPIDDENSFKEELRFWDSEGESLMKHLGRASVFSHYQMYSYVAEEYEQALAFAPTSRDLLLRTIEAQRLIGNLVRAKELERRQIRRN